jgi:intracellular sulfur oxidation DsrE/DsrF family protein
MNRRLLIQAGTLGALLASAPFFVASHAQTAGPAGKKHHKLVVQMSDNDPAKWSLALNNIKNVQDDVGAANVDIEIVAFGPGINMLKLESPVGARIAEAMKAKVAVLACENTLRAQKLSRDDMLPAIGYVPAGVVEIMKKQSEGWAYLRP